MNKAGRDSNGRDSNVARFMTLTQPTEPTLDIIRSVLSTSNTLIHPNVYIKSESGETALAIRSGKGRPDSGRKGTHRATPGVGTGGDSGGRDDERGYRWCDPTHDNHCHRCGRTGHIASRCVTDMPPEIKAWVLGRPSVKTAGSRGRSPANETSQYVHITHGSRSHSPSGYGDISAALERTLYIHPNSPSRRSYPSSDYSD